MADSLSAALSTLRSRYGPQALQRGGGQIAAGVWPTDAFVLDTVLLPGGLPRGRITVLAAATRGASGRLTRVLTSPPAWWSPPRWGGGIAGSPWPERWPGRACPGWGSRWAVRAISGLR